MHCLSVRPICDQVNAGVRRAGNLVKIHWCRHKFALPRIHRLHYGAAPVFWGTEPHRLSRGHEMHRQTDARGTPDGSRRTQDAVPAMLSIADNDDGGQPSRGVNPPIMMSFGWRTPLLGCRHVSRNVLDGRSGAFSAPPAEHFASSHGCLSETARRCWVRQNGSRSSASRQPTEEANPTSIVGSS